MTGDYEAISTLLEIKDDAQGEGVNDSILQIQQFKQAYIHGKRTLTAKQNRRLMLLLSGMKVNEIAVVEGVSKQHVSESLSPPTAKAHQICKESVNIS